MRQTRYLLIVLMSVCCPALHSTAALQTELLIQMDGLTHSSSTNSSNGSTTEPHAAEPQVFVLAASNLPWDLDQALLRRLQKRILVPLPDSAARAAMLRGLLAARLAEGVQLEGLVQATEGYSGVCGGGGRLAMADDFLVG